MGGGQAHNSHSVIYLLSGHIFQCLNFELSPSVSLNDFLEALLKRLQENNSGIYGNSPHYAEMYRRYRCSQLEAIKAVVIRLQVLEKRIWSAL